MKTITLNVYTVQELKEQFPKGYQKAYERHCRWEQEDPNWHMEIFDSLEAIIKATGFKMVHWDLGAYNRSNSIRVEEIGATWKSECENGISGLSGNRALAWLENKVLAPLRIPYQGKRRWEVAKYGFYYRPGRVPPCPFTGVCFDEDYLDNLKQSLKSGRTVKEAVEDLASIYAKCLEAEIEGRCTEAAFEEEADCNDREFYEDGEIA